MVITPAEFHLLIGQIICSHMSRFAALLPILGLLLISGCGSSSSSGGVRGTELSYFPADDPYVVSVQTDPNSTAVQEGQGLIGKFSVSSVLEAALISRLQQAGINYQSDIRPLFGNPAMIGAAQTALGGTSTRSALAVWVTKDAGKLAALIRKFRLRSTGSHDGATLYPSGRSTFAVDGPTLVFSGTPSFVTAALDRHAHGGGFSSSSMTQDLGGLPQNALINVFGSLTGILSTSRAASARTVPWVAAIRGYGVAISATSSGLTVSYRLDTTGRPLTTAQLPIATASSSPSFAGTLPITVALNDPAQVFTFAEGAEQATSPSGYASFLRRQAAVRAKTGVDLPALAKLLTGTLIVASDTHTTIGRVTVSDPATAASDLNKLATQPRSVFSKATSVSKLGGGFYAVKERKQTITVGVLGNQLVAGRAPVSALRAFASAAPTTAPTAQGGLAFRVSLAQLLAPRIKGASSKLIQSIIGTLGDFSGWTSATTSALTGSATLAFK